jgi:hypothetical protein
VVFEMTLIVFLCSFSQIEYEINLASKKRLLSFAAHHLSKLDLMFLIALIDCID